MKTLELLGYAVGAALAAALTVVLLGGAAFGFWPLNWTQGQAAAVGVAATTAGIVTANVFLRTLTRAAQQRISV